MTREELIKFTDQQHEIARHGQAIQAVLGCAAERATEIVFRLIWHGRNPVIFHRAIAIGYGYRQALRLARLSEAESILLSNSLLIKNPHNPAKTAA